MDEVLQHLIDPFTCKEYIQIDKVASVMDAAIPLGGASFQTPSCNTENAVDEEALSDPEIKAVQALELLEKLGEFGTSTDNGPMLSELSSMQQF